MAGAEGFEPPEWLDQNQLPYHLATPQYCCSLLLYLVSVLYILLGTYHDVKLLLFEQPELFAAAGFFVDFIVKTAYVVVCNRVVHKVLNPALSYRAAFYVPAKAANLPLFIKFVHFCHRKILPHNRKIC